MVMMTTDVEAIPPMIPLVTRFSTVVLRKLFPSEIPSFSIGHIEVREIAVALRKEDVTRTIIVIVKRIKRTNPA